MICIKMRMPTAEISTGWFYYISLASCKVWKHLQTLYPMLCMGFKADAHHCNTWKSARNNESKQPKKLVYHVPIFKKTFKFKSEINHHSPVSHLMSHYLNACFITISLMTHISRLYYEIWMHFPTAWFNYMWDDSSTEWKITIGFLNTEFLLF